MNPIFRFAMLCSLLIISLQKAQGQCWQRQYPEYPTETINAILHITPADCIAVGNGGLIERSTDSGRFWTVLNYVSFGHLQSVCFPNAATGYIGGSGGTVLKSTDGGFTWNPSTGFRDSILINSVSFRNADTGYVAGDSLIWKTYDGGASWTKYPVATMLSPLDYIKAFSTDTVYAYYPGVLLRSYDNGQTWNQTLQPLRFYQVDFLTPSYGWGINNAGNMYKTTDGGLTWTLKKNIYINRTDLGDMQVLDTNNVYFTHNGGGIGLHSILSTHDGGTNWQLVPGSDMFVYSSCLHFSDPVNGIVGNHRGGISVTKDNYNYSLRTNNGSRFTTPVAAYGHLESMFFADSLHGIAVGFDRSLITHNGGVTWAPGGLMPFGTTAMQISMPDSAHAWVVDVSGHLIKTTDGGLTWSLVLRNYSCNDAKLFSKDFGMMAAIDGVKASSDGGTTWTTVLSQSGKPFVKVAFSDSLTWVAFSADSVYKSVDAGATWSAGLPYMSSNFPIEVSLFDTSRFYIGTVIDVVKTTNGGITMTRTYPSFPPAGDWLNKAKISFIDTLKGMVTSADWYGENYRHAVLRKTSNGCASWEKVAINTKDAITSVCYKSDAKAWFCTNFGSIYTLYPNCPASSYAPMLNRINYAGCADQPFMVRVANMATYTAADTLSATLKLGSTIVQTLSVNAQGDILINPPAATASYILEVKLVNALHPQGLIKSIPVTIQAVANPQFTYWHSNVLPNICAGESVVIGYPVTSGLGTPFDYELRMIKKNGVDSLIASSQFIMGVIPDDTCRLYYKVRLGGGICYSSPYFYSDTLTINVIAPPTASAHLSALSNNTLFCAGDSLTIMAATQQAGTTGIRFDFHKVTGNTDIVVQSGTAATLHISSLQDTSIYYARITPGAGICIGRDTFNSDSIRVDVIKYPGLSASLTSNIPNNQVCAGDTIVLFANDNLVGSPKNYRFLTVSAPNPRTLQSDTLNTYRAVLPGNTEIFCEVSYPGNACYSVYSDTVRMTVTATPVPALLSLSNDSLIATYYTGALYQWYHNGVTDPTTTTNIYAPAGRGTYTVAYSLNGCNAPLSAPYTVSGNSVYTGKQQQLRIYPNPVIDEVMIDAGQAIHQIVLVDPFGRKVYEFKGLNTRQYTIRMNSLPAGTYMLLLSGAQFNYKTTLVKAAHL